jgi:L-ascorbate metabolism protein UlaG (beta-lactamase superfamily)
MDFQYFGHSTFQVTVTGKKLLFDPFITPNPLAAGIKIDELKPDYILISHAHSDHMADAATIAINSGALVIASFEVCNWLGKKGVKNVHPLGIGGKKDFDFGTVKVFTAHHSSSFEDGSYGGTPTGFVIKSNEKNFYFAGDTALTLDMKLVPMFTKVDFAVLPIGDNFTMGYEDAADAAKMVETKTVIGVHYDTFGFIKIDKEKAQQYFKDKGLELKLPEIGSTIKV